MKKKFASVDISDAVLYGNFHRTSEDTPEIRYELEGPASTLSVPVMGFWMDDNERSIRDMKLLQLYTRRHGDGQPVMSIWINLEEKAPTKRYRTETPTHWAYLTKGGSYMSMVQYDPMLHPTETELTDLMEDLSKSLF